MCTAKITDWFVTNDTCFFCSAPLGPGTLVHWEGAFGLTLHPACAAALGRHLIADAREAEMSSPCPGHWPRRAERAFLATLAPAGGSSRGR